MLFLLLFVKAVRKGGSQQVAPLVIRVSVMPLYPDEADLMYFGELIQSLPEVGIFKLVLASAPPLLPPGVNPPLVEGIA